MSTDAVPGLVAVLDGSLPTPSGYGTVGAVPGAEARARLAALVDAEAAIPASVDALTFPGRRITFPIVLDDRWNRAALARYVRSVRARAAYLPSNVEYLARNNGLRGAAKALEKLVGTDWVCRRAPPLASRSSPG